MKISLSRLARNVLEYALKQRENPALLRLIEDRSGLTNLAVAAFGLPIVVLLFGVALDFVRVPLARHALEIALSKGAFDTTLVPSAQFDDGIAPDSSYFGSEPFTPVGKNFCFLGESEGTVEQAARVNSCKPTVNSKTSNSFFIADGAGNIIVEFEKRAVQLADITLNASPISWFFENPHLSFGVYSTNVSLTSGKPTGELLRIGSTGSDADLQDYAHEMSQYFLNKGSIGWKVEGCGTTILNPISSVVRRDEGCEDYWIPSFWLIGFGKVGLKPFLGSLSLYPTSSPDGEIIVRSYIARSFNRPGGIVNRMNTPVASSGAG